MLATLAIALADAPAFFSEVAAVLVVGALVAFVGFRFGLVPIVGFLLAGVLIGPHGLALVRDPALVDAAAEVGVILLLFTIGIEFSIEKLSRIRRLIFVGGGLQVGLATLLTMGLLAVLGVAWKVGLYTGFLVALSSTAIVLKLLADRSEANAEHGQASLGILIFQDLAVVAMVLLVPMLAGEGGSTLDIVWALTKATLLIAAVLLFARRIMPIILEAVARTCSPEIFLLTIIAICFGTAYLTSLAGISLSLGAFLAGLVVSESPFSEHALGEILPLQILFSATFFVSVGMLLDVRFLVANLPLVLGVIAFVLVVKLLTAGVAVAALRARHAVTAATTLMLAQIGEFSFVLERVGRDVGLSPAGLDDTGAQAFIAATVLLMVATPALSAVGTRLSRRIDEGEQAADRSVMQHDAALEGETFENAENHVIVAGFGEAARRLCRALDGAAVPFVITTLSPAGATEAEKKGYRVLRGDSSRQRTLFLAGLENAKAVVVADDDPLMAERIAAVARVTNPTARVVIRTRYETEVESLHEAGADCVITEELESILQLFAEILRTYRIDAAEIEKREEAVRSGNYVGLLAERDSTALKNQYSLDDDYLDSPTVTIRATTPAADQSVQSDRMVVLGSGDARAARASGAREIDTERTIELRPDPATNCTHIGSVRAVLPSAKGCEECLRIGSRWVHLRICMTCGHVGCCDSSPNRHASAHHRATSHPIMRSLEPGEQWGWCYIDQEIL